MWHFPEQLLGGWLADNAESLVKKKKKLGEATMNPGSPCAEMELYPNFGEAFLERSGRCLSSPTADHRATAATILQLLGLLGIFEKYQRSYREYRATRAFRASPLSKSMIGWRSILNSTDLHLNTMKGGWASLMSIGWGLITELFHSDPGFKSLLWTFVLPRDSIHGLLYLYC